MTTSVHYGQHYVSSADNVPGIITVAPDSHFGPVTQTMQHRHTPQSVPKYVSMPEKPTILNHTLNVGVPAVSQENPVVMKLEQHTMQPQILQQQVPVPAPKLWLLVEWEMPVGEPNTYSVIDSSELMLHNTNGRTRETIHTGKTIFVKKKNRVQQATVVIISDDKQFIETELTQLRKMAAENLSRMSNPSQDYAAKRRRVESSTMVQDEHEPNSPEYEPMPVQTHAATASWVSKCKPDRVLSPSPSVMSSTPLQIRQPPPMTFDQQTQTDAKFFPQDEGSRAGMQELTKILSLQESILSEQKTVRMENEYNRKMMYDMAEQMSLFSETLKQLVAKVESSSRQEYKYEITEVVKSPAQPVSNYVVLGTGGEESRDRASSVAESLIQRPETTDNSNTVAIDQISMQDDSSTSFNHSQYYAKDDTPSNASTPKNLNLSFSKRISSSALSLSNASAYSQQSNDPKSAVKDMLKDWNDDESDDGEMTSIGPNNTMVKKQVLRAINWTNYKAATRKLLMTLFSREMLATHTLTGRPSPAFIGDRAKPVKDKLDQKVIADIIAIVTKSCSVTEPMVRTAITTKCADENKMSRMKTNKGPAAAQTSMKQYVKDVTPPVGSSTDTTNHQPPAPDMSHGRRTKRDNKENVH